MKSTGQTIACKPFAERSVKPFQNKGFVSVAQKTELTALEAVYDNVGISGVPFEVKVGTKVWVKADHYTSGWAKAIYRIPGTDEEVILVPYSDVVLVD
jgi:hypothetical protein